MSLVETSYQEIERDIWAWINEFVTVPNAMFEYKFAPCPFAAKAVAAKTVDVQIWPSGDVRQFIRAHSLELRHSKQLTTRVMCFPPRTRYAFGLNDYVEELNRDLVASNVFLNAGVARTSHSRYPGSNHNDPYCIVIANSLDAVLAGAKTLAKTEYYKNWPAAHYEHVVERRARFAKNFGVDS
jgi:hypothetical protein